MDKERIIAIMQEAGLCMGDANEPECALFVTEKLLIIFANLAYAAGQRDERDACAEAVLNAPIKTARQNQREACANAIRVRGEE